jgi:hypothetical protein
MSREEPHRRLWPDTGEVGHESVEVAVLTHRDGSELVLPLENNAVAAAPLIRITGASTRWDRARRRLLWAGVRSGIARPLLRPRTTVPSRHADEKGPSLHEYLESALSERELSISAAFGPGRINQKPVVRVMRKDGRTLAFAKVGWSELTAQLVRHEARFLAETTKSPIPGVCTPELLHLGVWGRFHVAVYSAELATNKPRLTPEVFRAVTEYLPSETSAPGPDPVRMGSPESQDASWYEFVLGGCDEWARRWGGIPLEIGRWHGDWTPWNSGGTGESPVILWDWERTEPDAPVGFDPLNYYLQPSLLARRDSVGEALDAAGEVMHAIGVPTEHQRAVTWWYALAVISRHSRAGSRGTSQTILEGLRNMLNGL